MTTASTGTTLADVTVLGQPTPQGSVLPFVAGGKARVRYRPAVGEYRLRLAQALWAGTPRPTHHPGPCGVLIDVDLLRPRAHYRTGRNAHLLRDDAPEYPIGRNSGDVDKFARLCLDACTDAGVWADDCQAVVVTVAKRYAPAASLWLRVWALA